MFVEVIMAVGESKSATGSEEFQLPFPTSLQAHPHLVLLLRVMP